jgi:predicted RNA-binding protein
MTPQEKAEELLKKYFRDSDLLVEDLTWIQAKECALIAVDEILKDKEEIDGMRIINDPYWIEVKQEIENL